MRKIRKRLKVKKYVEYEDNIYTCYLQLYLWSKYSETLGFWKQDLFVKYFRSRILRAEQFFKDRVSENKYNTIIIQVSIILSVFILMVLSTPGTAYKFYFQCFTTMCNKDIVKTFGYQRNMLLFKSANYQESY